MHWEDSASLLGVLANTAQPESKQEGTPDKPKVRDVKELL